MATAIESARLAMDEHTLRKRRDRLFNPNTAPYVDLQAAMFGPFVPPPQVPPPPPPTVSVQPPPFTPPIQPPPPQPPPPQPPPPPPPPQPNPSIPLFLPPLYRPVSQPQPQQTPPPLTPPKSGKSKADRQASRNARRMQPEGAGSSSDRTWRRKVGLPAGLPSFDISPSAILSPLRSPRTRIMPKDPS